MAKSRAKKQTKEEPNPEPQSKLLDPKAVHELLGIMGP